MDRIVFSIAAVFGTLRILGFESEAFQAFAHLFVGGLFASGWMLFTHAKDCDEEFRGWHYMWLAVALSVVELACFLYFKVL